jgi:hypothetical protein
VILRYWTHNRSWGKPLKPLGLGSPLQMRKKKKLIVYLKRKKKKEKEIYVICLCE